MKCLLGLGSNQGQSDILLNLAKEEIRKKVGLILKSSGRFETEPWGLKSQNVFLNEVILVETTILPLNLLKTTQIIEQNIGRNKSEHWGPRDIDIDILDYENVKCSFFDLTLPHSQNLNRKFILSLVKTIDPEYRFVGIKNSVSDLLINCKDDSWLKPQNK